MLTWRNVSCVAQRNSLDVFFPFFSLFHAVVFPVLTLYIKGFHFVMTCEMSHHKVCEEMRCSWTSAFYFDWYFGKRVMGNLAVIATTECT